MEYKQSIENQIRDEKILREIQDEKIWRDLGLSNAEVEAENEAQIEALEEWNKTELLFIKGIGKKTIESYGDDITEITKKY